MDNENFKKYAIEEYSSLLQEERKGLTFYEIKTDLKQKDEENKIQVLGVGPENDGPVKSILMMGETGAGKTRLINSMVNHLYGVKFEDNFRFILKDQIESNDKHDTQSQTDYITVYNIYNQPGMPYDSNYLLIDTPGFGDTLGEDRQKMNRDRIRNFLVHDYGIDDLNCVGLVAKANHNRLSCHQKVIFEEFTSLLADDVSQITHLFATFASDDTKVIEVVRQEGIEFGNMYEFDNWPLDVPQKSCSSVSKRAHKEEYVKFRWNNMQDEYERLFTALRNFSSVSLRRTRNVMQEIRLLEDIKIKLKNRIKDICDTINSIKDQIRMHHQNVDEIRKVKLKMRVQKDRREKTSNSDHAHNCTICKKTCFHYHVQFDYQAALKGTAAGGVGGLATAGSVILADAIFFSEVGLIFGPLGVVVGCAAGTVIGVATGVAVWASEKKPIYYCPWCVDSAKNSDPTIDTTCGTDGCTHGKSDHREENTIIKIYYENTINDHAKSQIDKAEIEISKIEETLESKKRSVKEFQSNLSNDAKRLVDITNKVKELTYGYKTLNPQAVIDGLILEERENSLHVDVLIKLKGTVRMLSEREDQNCMDDADDLLSKWFSSATSLYQ